MILADHDTVIEASRKMNEAANKLADMASDVAQAKAIKEYDADRRKRLLSVLVTEQLDKGVKSTAEAENRAKATPSWGTHLNDLQGQLQAAQRVIETHAATVIQYEAARSVLSLEKQKMGL